jgi:hypothetical protein
MGLCAKMRELIITQMMDRENRRFMFAGRLKDVINLQAIQT